MTRLFANDLAAQSDYPLHLALGFLVFLFINASVISGSTVFISSKNFIWNGNNPVSIYIYRDIFREAYNFALNFCVVIIMVFSLQKHIDGASWSIIPAFLFLLLNAVWVKIIIGVVGARFRDSRHLVDMIMRVMFFVSPVIWMKHQVGDAIRLLSWNPIYHFIEVVRAPILDGNVPLHSWSFVIICTGLGWSFAIVTYSVCLKKIHYWI